MKKRSIYLLVLLMLGISLVCVGSVNAAETMVLKHALFWPPKNPHAIMMKWWCDQIENRTKGRVKFEHYFSQSLLKIPDLLTGTASGIAQVSCIAPGYIPSNVPLAAIWGLPYLHRSPWVQLSVMNELIKTYPPVQEEWKDDGVRLLFCGPCAGGGLFTGKKQVKTLEDLRGVKFRTFGWVGKAINRLGAVSVSIPSPEMYTAIQRGTVDGAMFWAGACGIYKLHEVCKYATFNTGLDGCCAAYAFMNLKVWNNLPVDVKTVIEDLNDEMVDVATEIWMKPERGSVDFMKKQGMVFYALPDEERARWTKKADPDGLHREWAKGVSGKYGVPAEEYLGKVKELIKKYRPLDTSGYQIPQ